MKKRLSYIIGNLNDGGQERQLFYLLSELQKLKKFELTLFVWDFNSSDKYFKPLKDIGIEIIGFKSDISIFLKILKIRKEIKHNSAKVLQSYTYYLNFICWLATIFSNTKPIGGLRSSVRYIYQSSKFYFYLNFFVPKTIVSNNYASQEELNKITGFRKKKLYIIPNKLNISNFSNKPSVITKPILTCSIGRIDQNKRVDMIISLIEMLKQQGYIILHKHAGEGILRNNLMEEVKMKGLEKEIKFLGRVSDVKNLLEESNFLVHTATTEGMPNVILEAMASNRAIISTDCGDVSYLVKDNENGFIIPIGDLNALVTKTKFLMDNTDMIITMGRKSREIVEEKFDLSKLADEILSLYKKLGVC